VALPIAARFPGRYVGVDIAAEMLNRLRENTWHDRSPLLVYADVHHLPFQSATFDAAVVVALFHLLPNRVDAITEVARTLRPRGLLFHGRTEYRGEHGQLVERLRHYRSSGRAANDTKPVPQRIHDDLASKLAYETSINVGVWDVVTTVRELADAFAARLWSGTWKLSDAEVARGAEDMVRIAKNQGIGPDESLCHQRAMYLDVYRAGPWVAK